MSSVSVVIPLYNHDQYIENTLESVFSQTLCPAQIIVVNDGSADNSDVVMSRIIKKHPEVIYWSQPNQGAHQAINSGIHRATSDYIAILNSDDVYHPARLENCVQTLDKQPEISVVATGIDFINEKGAIIDNPWYEQAKKFYKTSGDMGLALMNGNFIMTTSNFVIRRSLFSEIGFFFPLRYAHDLEFLLRIISSRKSIHILEHSLVTYRLHKKNTIAEDHKKVRIEWAFCCAKYMWMLGFASQQKQGWDYLEKMIQVTDKHSLTRLIPVLHAYFQELSLTGRSWESLFDDKDFLALVYRMA